MKLKKTLSLSVITSILISFTNTNIPLAKNKESIKNLEPYLRYEQSINPKSVSQNGFLAYFYNDENFSILNNIGFNVNSAKLIEEENIKSARFVGYIKPSESKIYKFTTSNNNSLLKINGELIHSKYENKSIYLEKDNLYLIELELSGDIDNLSLSILNDNDEIEKIPNNNILLPMLNDDFEIKIMSPISMLDDRNLFTDSDNDGIPNEWEIDGYTFKDNKIIKWSDNIDSNMYRKYVSNPNKKKTANDPYTDMQKVIGQIPSANKFESRDPLIPAIPIVSVGMEKLLISKNENVTEGISGTKSVSTSKSSNTIDSGQIGGSIGSSYPNILFKLFSFGVSGSYTRTISTTTTVQNTDSTSWSQQLGINTADSAYLNANIRYHNTGTAPIYELRPTSNLVLQNSKASIATIRSGPNQIGNSLAPGKTYPNEGTAPISLNTANELGNVKISINSTILNQLQTGEENINLETSQYNGQYAIINSEGNFATDSTKTWAPIITEIEETSANIILKTPTSTSERFIATKSKQDSNDTTPVLTIKQALKKSFDLIELDGKLYYQEVNGVRYPISENSITYIFDTNTANRINELLKNSPNQNLLDLTIERGMNITILTPDFYDSGNQQSENFWSNMIRTENGLLLKSNTKAILNKKLNIKKDTDYVISFPLKKSSNNLNLEFEILDNKTGKKILKRANINNSNLNSYKLEDILLQSYDINSDDVTLSIKNTSNSDIYLGNFKVTNLRRSENNFIKDVWKLESRYKSYAVLSYEPWFQNNVGLWSKGEPGHIQNWRFEYHPDKDAYMIKENITINKLALVGGISSNNNVFVSTPNSTSNEQYWILDTVGDGYYILKSYANPNLVLEVDMSSTKNNVRLAPRTNNSNQQFKLIK